MNNVLAKNIGGLIGLVLAVIVNAIQTSLPGWAGTLIGLAICYPIYGPQALNIAYTMGLIIFFSAAFGNCIGILWASHNSKKPPEKAN